MRLHHFALIVSSENSVDFYKKLGFVEIFRKVRNYDTVVLMTGHDIKLEVFIDSTHPKRMSNPEALGVRHIAVCVEDFEKARQELDCGPILKDWLGERYCMTADPDGLPIELHE